MSEPPLYRRRSARVLLLDTAGRILLLRNMVDGARPELGYVWLTPGGGVNDGEPLSHAAARELREEISLVVEPRELGQPVAYCAGYADLGWASGLFRDDFFFHRIELHEVDIGRMEALERANHGGHRWWPVEELASSTEIIIPLELAGLVADLLAGRVAAQPVRLPWHH
jgi:8-oxo-dGTP pyrophosphatase MutT (NUDIX family)